ncbi:MAG: CoA-binding protein [Bacteroidia bacterium]|nr:CoA-binding protein [Bacteroidia bacterium]
MTPYTLVLGASENPTRYSHLAIKRLRQHGHAVYALGLRPGKVDDVIIQTGHPAFSGVDTVTLYIGPSRQDDIIEYVLRLQPRRVIFNPGTENEKFEQKLKEAGILVEEACTLVMLGTGQY